MPPRDPKLCPALQTAHPGDFAPSTTAVADFPEPWLIEFGDGQRHHVEIEARSESTRGEEIIHVLWRIAGSSWQQTYYANPAKMRKNW